MLLTSRRLFCLYLTFFLHRCTQCDQRSPQSTSEPGLIDENDNIAKSLNYFHDKSKVPMNLQNDRGGIRFEGQNCANCRFLVDSTDPNVGQCKLLMKGLVKKAGWCSSWNIKR